MKWHTSVITAKFRERLHVSIRPLPYSTTAEDAPIPLCGSLDPKGSYRFLIPRLLRAGLTTALPNNSKTGAGAATARKFTAPPPLLPPFHQIDRRCLAGLPFSRLRLKKWHGSLRMIPRREIGEGGGTGRRHRVPAQQQCRGKPACQCCVKIGPASPPDILWFSERSLLYDLRLLNYLPQQPPGCTTSFQPTTSSRALSVIQWIIVGKYFAYLQARFGERLQFDDISTLCISPI